MTHITDEHKLKTLLEYAMLINSENTKYNLTGHKTLHDIINNLIIGSLKPLDSLDVPRGTLFADLGTGAGIPGIPISIKYHESNGILFDSNHKKINFINEASLSLSISNISAIDSRIEDIGRLSEYRGLFDIVFTRAMADIYTVAELGAPLLKPGGFLFLYINKSQMNVDDYVINHIREVGLSPYPLLNFRDTSVYNENEGLILYKENKTSDKYPRRMAIIKRMAKQ